MQNIDQEWRELSERYAQLSDEEIEVLANQAYELTDMARELLQSEVARRHLKIQLATEPPAPEEDREFTIPDEEFDPAALDLVSVARAWDMDDARELKTIFTDAGVPSFFGPNNAEDVEPLATLFKSEQTKAAKRGFDVGIEIKTPRSYQQRASAALRWADRQLDRKSTRLN